MDPSNSPHNNPRRASGPTASSLLARFLPGISPQHKMDQPRRTIPVPAVAYPDPALNQHDSFNETGEAPQREMYPELESLDTPQLHTPQRQETTTTANDVEDIEFALPKRARPGLRERKPNMSLKATENVYTTPQRPRSQKKKSAIEQLVGADLTPVVSNRTAVRNEIASKTTALRNRFLVEKKDFWLPLLPSNNYIRKLVEKHNALPAEELAKLPDTSPYVEIDAQPKGITAVMKPYQLSGLSFMMYLHRNVSRNIQLSVYRANCIFRVCQAS